jgi:type II secretory pathway predicted ATPase ExeA
MYERFYGVGERPFTLLPDPEFLFLSDKHQAALDMLETAISSHSGFCVVSGEIGAGKTTLIREILNRLDGSVRVGLVSNTHPSFGELLQWIMAAYGLPCGSSDKLELRKQFVDFAIQQYAKNKHTLLIIDEAQNLSQSSLEELCMLSNVNSGKDPVLQVILLGQHQLRENLTNPALKQFAQRIALDYHLDGLSEMEVRQYIQHRLRHAGGNPDLFTESACSAVYRASSGIPRLINRLCDLCMVYGCTEERLSIDAELVNRVDEDQRMGRLLSGQEVAGQESRHASRGVNEAPVAIAAQSASTRHAEPVHEKHPAAERSAATNNFINDMSSVLLPKKDASVSSATEETRSAATVTELHTLVVNSEKHRQPAKGERSAVWLLAGVATMVGITGWMTRDLWTSEGIIAEKSEQVGEFVRTLMPGSSSLDPNESNPAAVFMDPAQRKAKLEREAELERKAKLQRKAELRRKTEQLREAERLARLQEEARQLELEEARQLDREQQARREQQRSKQAPGSVTAGMSVRRP